MSQTPDRQLRDTLERAQAEAAKLRAERDRLEALLADRGALAGEVQQLRARAERLEAELGETKVANERLEIARSVAAGDASEARAEVGALRTMLWRLRPGAQREARADSEAAGLHVETFRRKVFSSVDSVFAPARQYLERLRPEQVLGISDVYEDGTGVLAIWHWGEPAAEAVPGSAVKLEVLSGGALSRWEATLEHARLLASKLPPHRLISLTHVSNDGGGLVAIWSWKDSRPQP